MMSARLMLHFWWNPKVLVFWIVVQPPLLAALKGAEALFSKIHENDTRIPARQPEEGQHCRILIWCDQSIPCFSLLSLIPVQSLLDDKATERDALSTRAACWFRNSCLLEMRMSLLNVDPTLCFRNFCATLDTFWRARIDLCMYSLVQPQTHLPIYGSVFVYTSSRPVFEALDPRCDGHCGLPHAVLTSESVRHVSFLPKQLVGPFVKTVVKSCIPLTRLQGEELACPAEDDEEPVDELG